MGGGAWPFLVRGLICLVDSVNELLKRAQKTVTALQDLVRIHDLAHSPATAGPFFAPSSSPIRPTHLGRSTSACSPSGDRSHHSPLLTPSRATTSSTNLLCHRPLPGVSLPPPPPTTGGGVGTSPPLTASEAPVPLPACRECGKVFSWWTFRLLCPVCDQAFCSTCYNKSLLTKCFRDKGCRRCEEVVERQSYFHRRCLALLESGVACLLHLPHASPIEWKTPGLVTAGCGPGERPSSLHVWLNYDVDAGKFRWRTVQRRNNRPLACGSVPVGFIGNVECERPRSVVLLVHNLRHASKPPRAIRFRFTCDLDARLWAEAIELAWTLFGPEQRRDNHGISPLPPLQQHSSDEEPVVAAEA
eukprot:Polyplicarium_translucidae@DN483_c0_g1_i1.p1